MDSNNSSSNGNFGSTTERDGKEWDLNSFEVGKRLGTGRFGSVYLARDISSGFVVALKIMFKNEITSEAQYQVRREVEIQFHLQ